jgi:hypothetical protein
MQNLFDEHSNLRLLRCSRSGDVEHPDAVLLDEPPERHFGPRKSRRRLGKVEHGPSVLAGKLNGLFRAAGQNLTD